jgi:hypothetical protein
VVLSCDAIPHTGLMQCVARRIVDKHMLHLIKMWLQVPVEEEDEKGNQRLTGGKDNDRGAPQGGVVSPLHANLYMNRMLKGWKQSKRGEQFQARIVAYAEDFVILSPRKSERGTELGAGDADAVGADAQRAEDEHTERASGAVPLSGLYLRAALQPAHGAGVHRM